MQLIQSVSYSNIVRIVYLVLHEPYTTLKLFYTHVLLSRIIDKWTRTDGLNFENSRKYFHNLEILRFLDGFSGLKRNSEDVRYSKWEIDILLKMIRPNPESLSHMDSGSDNVFY